MMKMMMTIFLTGLIDKESSLSHIQMGIHVKLFCMDKAWIMEDDEEEDDTIPDWSQGEEGEEVSRWCLCRWFLFNMDAVVISFVNY
jgi:hypothetical protein